MVVVFKGVKPRPENPAAPRCPAFTVLEILVALALIALLTTLLLPSLAKGKARARRSQSIHNQQQISIAFREYLQDHRGEYPRIRGFAGAGGKRGDFASQARTRKPEPEVVAIFGADTPPEERPLNQYISNREVFHDPADAGGTSFRVSSCFDAFGTSYLPQMGEDQFRVKRVLGSRTDTPGSYGWRSLRETELSNPVNKIIQGDWNWPYDQQDSWHGDHGEAGHVMLYADGHVSYFVFPDTAVMLKWMTPPHRRDAQGRAELNAKGDPVIDEEKFRSLSPEPFRSTAGEPARYIDTGFLWW